MSGEVSRAKDTSLRVPDMWGGLNILSDKFGSAWVAEVAEWWRIVDNLNCKPVKTGRSTTSAELTVPDGVLQWLNRCAPMMDGESLERERGRCESHKSKIPTDHVREQ